MGFRAYIGRTELGIYGWVHGKGMTDGPKKVERGSGTYDLLQYYMCACIILMQVVK